MKINGIVIGKGTPITDGRTLQAMEQQGHFTRPHKHHPYVDEGNNPTRFTWNGSNYSIRYFDGCFYPFVVREDPQS